jgi:tryptophan synthase beta chain
MVRISYDQKPYRKILMETWGGTCIPSPSSETEAGRRFLEQDPDTPGSLGMAISEAVEAAVSDQSGETKYSLGSVLNHVLLHQTIIGQEAKKQLALAGIKKPDVVIGCAGGGSNFAGLSFPFVCDKIHGDEITIIPVEPQSCPSLTKAPFAYDFGDTSGMTPLLPMHTLGHNFVAPPLHAGGLRYHGMAPLVSQAVVEGLLEPQSIPQLECYAAAVQWARTEGTICAPETSHAIAATIREAKKAKEEGREKVILFGYSGHGLLDLAGYDAYFNGRLENYEIPEEEFRKSLLSSLEGLPKAEMKKIGKW